MARDDKGRLLKGHAKIGICGAPKGNTPWNKGKKGLQEAWNKGKKSDHTPWNKGTKGLCKAWNKGLLDENLSMRQRGENNPNWKGGVVPEYKRARTSIDFRLWRESVFARDNWTCQKYGTKGGRLHPHHIKGFTQFPELRFAIDNGITLSEKAHKEFHHKYGKKNNHKDQIIEFLKQDKYGA